MAYHNHQQQSQQQHRAFYLDQLSLQCKAGCGFYGNSEWLGYCSICYKQQQHTQQPHLQQQQQQPQPQIISENDNQHHQSSTLSPGISSPPQRATSLIKSNVTKLLASPSSMLVNTFSTIQSSIVNTAKSSFRASTNLLSDTSSVLSENMSTSKISQNQQSASISQQAKDQFLYERAWTDCLKSTQKFADEFLKKHADYSIVDLSDIIHDFYHSMGSRFENHQIYKGASADQVDLLIDNMERILNQYIYQPISARIIIEDEEHNMAIQKRIKSLSRITVEHLEIDINFNDPIVHNILDRAICQIVEMNSRTSTIDKLDCIVSCSKTILELLQFTSSGQSSVPVGADQFLPVLVFVVIQANPPMLPADMKYLTRFSNPCRLMSGETGYYFTNLCCALEFIEKASGASLNISEEEFAKYISGEVIPETKSQFNTYLCDGLRTMCYNQATLDDLRNRREARSNKIDELFELIDVHMEAHRANLRESETFSSSFYKKLHPNLSQDYLDLYAQDKEHAIKLIPSFLRQSIVMRLDPEIRLVDVQTTTEIENEQELATASDNQPVEESRITSKIPSLSPVEQLESSIQSLKLPDPIQPEPLMPNKLDTKAPKQQQQQDTK